MKILIAEDDEDQLEVRSLLLAKCGYETIAVSNSASALVEAAAHKPDCAVVDWKFPTEELGLHLIRALKDLDQAIRVFVLTGGDPLRFNKLPENGLVEQVIRKGSSTTYLLKALRELAGKIEPKLAELHETLKREGSVTFDVKAIPRSSRSELIGLTTDGALKFRLAAPPEKGQANEELREAVAECFAVPKSKVELLLGETSQRKRVRVTKR